MRFPYVLWDFDGTLFDTYPPLARSIRRALADFDVAVQEDTIAAMLRGTLSNTLATLTARYDLHLVALQDRMTFYSRQTTVRDKHPFPGAIRTLERVLVCGGQNFLVTHRDLDSLVVLLDWYRVTGLFADIITADDGFARKPDPESFNAMIERHALSRSRVLAVGDRDLDIQAGQAAGVHTCLFNARPSPGVMPDFVIGSFTELEHLLEAAPNNVESSPHG